MFYIKIHFILNKLWHHPYGRKRRTKEPFEGEGGEWKSWVKTQHLKY